MHWFKYFKSEHLLLFFVAKGRKLKAIWTLIFGLWKLDIFLID